MLIRRSEDSLISVHLVNICDTGASLQRTYTIKLCGYGLKIQYHQLFYSRGNRKNQLRNIRIMGVQLGNA